MSRTTARRSGCVECGAQRVTASYDLNRDQLMDLVDSVPPNWLEVVVHQHVPMFHMEHCVFCAVISPGTDKTNCGRPCDRHVVQLRDRVGAMHTLQADVACRNTLYNATAQSGAECVSELMRRGSRLVSDRIIGRNGNAGLRNHRKLRSTSRGRSVGSRSLAASSRDQPLGRDARYFGSETQSSGDSVGRHEGW